MLHKLISMDRSMNDNLTRIYVGDLVLWFSYETIVAFREPGQPRVVSENVWSNTTGRHLNAIDNGDKRNRVPHDVFQQKLEDLMNRVEVTL